MSNEKFSVHVAALTASTLHYDKVEKDVLHGAMGLASEGGELLDAVKKSLAYGANLDIENVKEEIGDALFYAQMICNSLGVSLDDIMQANIEKLAKRYPEGFNLDDAMARKDKAAA